MGLLHATASSKEVIISSAAMRPQLHTDAGPICSPGTLERSMGKHWRITIFLTTSIKSTRIRGMLCARSWFNASNCLHTRGLAFRQPSNSSGEDVILASDCWSSGAPPTGNGQGLRLRSSRRCEDGTEPSAEQLPCKHHLVWRYIQPWRMQLLQRWSQLGTRPLSRKGVKVSHHVQGPCHPGLCWLSLIPLVPLPLSLFL